MQDVPRLRRDLWRVARSRIGFPAIVIVFLPIGTGAASNLWAAVADSWRASADTVALVNGALGGIVSAAGCIAGGYLSDRIDRKTAYGFYGFFPAPFAFPFSLPPQPQSPYLPFPP